MKKIKLIIFICFILNFLYSCNTLKDGFKSQRKNSTDEFLVEKKRPLVIPPDFDKLPIPDQELSKNLEESNQIEEIIAKKDNKKTNEEKELSSNGSTEKFILDKIKN